MLDDSSLSLVLSPSDLANSLACRHLLALGYEVATGTRQPLGTRDEDVDLVAKHGDAHEQRYFERMAAAGRSIVTISMSTWDVDGLERAQVATLDAMRSGVDLIYQATFFDGRWRGHADFLERVDAPSELGNFSYEVIDTKLARHVKVSALLQTSNYSEHLLRLQGVLPARMHIELGDQTRASFNVRDFDSYYRVIKSHFENSLSSGISTTATYPSPVAHCSICDWADECKARRIDDDHLSLVASIGRTQIERLQRAGITTVAQLGATELAGVEGIGSRTFTRLRSQAALQLSQRKTGVASHLLLEPVENQGLCALPEPSHGDLFFDMEGDPYLGLDGIEYLFGVARVESGEPVYSAFWGHDAVGEKRAFEEFIDFVMASLRDDPDLHIYHYAPYETTAVKKLAARYGTREAEVDELLRGEVFVDLYRVVKQGIRISQDSYSIKKLEPFYMDARETDVTGGGDSIIAYEKWLDTGEQSILDDIEKYNKDDCESTWRLRDWLEARRVEAVAKFGELPRPIAETREASEKTTALEMQISQLHESLRVGEDEPEYEFRKLLGDLLEWHRRERKADWWRWHDLRKMSIDELYEDREALVLSSYEGVVGKEKNSDIHRYRFDPKQDHKFVVGSDTLDQATQGTAGEVWHLDDDAGVIDLKRSKDIDDLRALMPTGPRKYDAQQQSLLAIAQSIRDSETAQFQAGIDLLERAEPRLESHRSLGEVLRESGNATDAACALAIDLDDTCLAIQGPPGSGKTYSGAEIVRALVGQGKRVGITATGHKVIGNLLEAVVDHDVEGSVRVMQRCPADQRCGAPGVAWAKGNDVVVDALAGHNVDVVGGTAWLFAREDLRGEFDVLIVDEAGQMSLADVLAVSPAAKSLILLGDPQQLAQPSKGVHPVGAGLSSLEHLLNGHKTIPESLGLLLDKTWRMHPEVCSFISDAYYEGRLVSEDSCATQVIETEDAGIRYLPVAHSGNRISSVEEANLIRRVIDGLLGKSWTNRNGESSKLALDDFLVLAPYNAQVTVLQQQLANGVRIGTVDKMQGQEAAVVLYSMCASSPQDISRGIDFLFSANRLNVAISRARCLAYLVCSPELLTVVCHRPAQAMLANGLCRYVELASS